MNEITLTKGERAIIELLAANHEGLTLEEIAERCKTTSNSAKVLIHRLRTKGLRIASPRHTSRKGPRKGIRQAYRLAGEP